jgi:hypothetical protein
MAGVRVSAPAPREQPPLVAVAVVCVLVEVAPLGCATVGGVAEPLVVAPASPVEGAVSVVCEVPVPFPVKPTVRGGYDAGDWQMLTEVAVAVVVDVMIGVWVGATPPSTGTGLLLAVVGTADATHFQVEGQSESAVHTETLGWHEPG